MGITKEEFKRLLALPLEEKVKIARYRIEEWYEYWNGNVYVSFSGGKDSTVLLHLVRSIYPEVKAVFINNGLEFPEVREFVRTVDNVIWLRPRITFKQVIERYGYPVISKEQAQYIRVYRTTDNEEIKRKKWYRLKNGLGKISERWKFLVNAPFKISEQCCYHLREGPALSFEKRTGMRPFIGLLANESRRRRHVFLKHGCNIFNSKRPVSKPLSIWTEEDVWNYIKKYNLPYCKIYDLGYEGTGCIACMFGVHMEKEPNKFQRLKTTHPKLWEYCMYKLGLKGVLEYIGIKYQ